LALLGLLKTEYRISNHEYRMSKECILSILFKKNEQSETTLRHSAVRYSIFCGSLLGLVKFYTSPAHCSQRFFFDTVGKAAGIRQTQFTLGMISYRRAAAVTKIKSIAIFA
jgi:hypothetical protein